MRFIKVCYGKESGNPLIHIMISLDECAETKEKACEFANKFARYYMDKYQVIWAVVNGIIKRTESANKSIQ